MRDSATLTLRSFYHLIDLCSCRLHERPSCLANRCFAPQQTFVSQLLFDGHSIIILCHQSKSPVSDDYIISGPKCKQIVQDMRFLCDLYVTWVGSVELRVTLMYIMKPHRGNRVIVFGSYTR